jgi:hypothetical protein
MFLNKYNRLGIVKIKQHDSEEHRKQMNFDGQTRYCSHVKYISTIN